MTEETARTAAERTPSLQVLLGQAATFEDTAAILSLALQGIGDVDGAGLLPHRYIAAVYGELPRHLREELEEGTLRLMTGLADGEPWHADAAVELLLLSRSIFASRQRAAAAELAIARVLRNLHAHPPPTILAAGQAALGLGYYGEPAQWHRIYDAIGKDSIPVVVGGLMKTSWPALVAWIRDRLPDSDVERALLNMLPYFFITQGAAKAVELAHTMWPDLDEPARDEIARAFTRAGLDPEVIVSPPPASIVPTGNARDWGSDFQAVLAGHRDQEIAEAGSAGRYLRLRLEAAGINENEPAFARTLKQQIAKWHIGRRAGRVAADPMFSIVAEFNQPQGISRVLEILEQRTDTELEGAKAIRDESFETLSRLYPAPPKPAERDRVYPRYIRALQRLVIESDLAPRAVRQLLEFDAVDLADDAFAAHIVENESSFRTALDLAMARQDPTKYLSWLMDACVRTNEAEMLERFVAMLKERVANVAVRFSYIEIGPDQRVVPGPNLVVRYASLIGAFVNRGLKMYQDIINDET